MPRCLSVASIVEPFIGPPLSEWSTSPYGSTPKQIVAFPKTGGCATVVYGGSESNHQTVQPHAMDGEYIYGVTRNEVVRMSKVR